MGDPEPALYGLENSNRTGPDLWGKNQFNSNFPVALACYMRDIDVNPVYIAVNDDFTHRTTDQEITMGDVFQTSADGDGIRFEFETRFSAFGEFTADTIPSIDLVTMDADGRELAPIEIKLTVMPDQSTYARPENQWGTELVIRPVTSAHATFALAYSIIDRGNVGDVRRILSPVASSIQHWDNSTEILSRKEDITRCLVDLLVETHELQVPYLLQTVWKTQRKSPALQSQCFDIFAWSNNAVLKLFVDRAMREGRRRRVSRSLRECARTLKCLYDLLPDRTIQYDEIYQGMTHGTEASKSGSFSGVNTIKYMRHPRLMHPAIERDALRNIILNGGEQLLSPERRFDATIFFTAQGLFNR